MMRVLMALLSALLALAGCASNATSAEEIAAAEWVVEPLPLPVGAKDLYINVIRGTGADDIWLLTSAGIDHVQQRLVFHYDGQKWSDVTQQVPGRARDSIYPISRDDVWAVGRQGTAAHYDGTSWTVHAIGGFYFDFVDVFARPDDVWVAYAERGAVAHFDGTGWEIVKVPELDDSVVHELWGTAKKVLIPVNPKYPPTRMARFDGTAWSAETLGPGGVTLIAGSSDADIWALSRSNGGFHFDGSRWTRVSTLDTVPMWSLSVAGPTSAYAAGDNGVILRWDGSTWRQSRSGTRERLTAVYAPTDGKALAGGASLYRRK